MNDEIHISISLPLDDDGFLRRRCPSCELEFKWHSSDEAIGDSEITNQYFCPLCGHADGVDTWATPQQAEYMQQVSAPDIDRRVQEMMADAFKGVKGFTFKADNGYSSQEVPPEPLVEANDMTIVEPPCHPAEPIKIPPGSLASVHCLICGSLFSS